MVYIILAAKTLIHRWIVILWLKMEFSLTIIIVHSKRECGYGLWQATLISMLTSHIFKVSLISKIKRNLSIGVCNKAIYQPF